MVKTVTLTAETPQKVNFSESYPFYWIDNKSDGDVYASVGGTPEPDADNTYTITSGEKLRISGSLSNSLTLLGEGKVQVIASGIASCPFKSVKKGGETESALLPKSIGLTHFFDYKHGVNADNKTWTDRKSGIVSKADVSFNVSENCLEMGGNAFSLGFGEGLSAHTVYGIVCLSENVSGWQSLIAAYGAIPQFNICSKDGTLSIGAGSSSGYYQSTVPSYGEWHVCCITANEGFGAFYIDGSKVYSHNGYVKPQYTDEFPLCFGYGNIKMLAVCPNVAHSASIIAENSEYLKTKYIKSE